LSSRALFGQSERIASYVAAFGLADFGPCQAIGFADSFGTLEAGVVYHNWNPAKLSIEMSVASRSARWMTRERARLIFDYPFEQIGCELVWGRTELPIIGRVFKALGGDGYVIPGLFTLTVDQWRLWRDERLNHGLTQSADAS
jgi:hypothetical protein